MRKKYIDAFPALFPPLANVIAAIESGFCVVERAPRVGR